MDEDVSAFPERGIGAAIVEMHRNDPTKRTVIKLKQKQEMDDSDSESESSEEEFFDKEKIKRKFYSAMNNVKYSINMNLMPHFSEVKPVWLLGKCYHARSSITELIANSESVIKSEHTILSLDQFFEDFSSLIWLTYRKHFTQLANSNLTSDGGWGCTLRTSQMLLANAILIHMLKDGWRQSSHSMPSEWDPVYRMIVHLFNDESSESSPLALHELVRIGEKIGTKVGDWYGPSTAAYTLRNAVNHSSHHTLETFRVYVARDCTVYKEDVVRVSTRCKCCREPTCQDKYWRPVLILVSIRLGGAALNPIYIPCLESLLAHDLCVGIVGGRPKRSFYFVGFQGSKAIYLDPHYLQETVDMSNEDFLIDSFRCLCPKKLKFKKMDPSGAVGFYCRTREDFDHFCNTINSVIVPPKQQSEYPIFSVSEGCDPCYSGDEADGFLPPEEYLEKKQKENEKDKDEGEICTSSDKAAV